MDRLVFKVLKMLGQQPANNMHTSHGLKPLQVSSTGETESAITRSIEGHLGGMPEIFRTIETAPEAVRHLRIFRAAGTREVHSKAPHMATLLPLRTYYTHTFRAEIDIEVVDLVMEDYQTLLSRSVLADGKISQNLDLGIRFAIEHSDLKPTFASSLIRECTILYIVNRLVLLKAISAMVGLVTHESRDNRLRPLNGRSVDTGARELSVHHSGS
jgi:hypothetical protein